MPPISICSRPATARASPGSGPDARALRPPCRGPAGWGLRASAAHPNPSSTLNRARTMPANRTLLILPGDGIGPEVMAEVRRVVDWFARRRAVGFDLAEGLVGGAAIDAQGVPLTDETMARAMAADAVLLGAV